MKKKNVINLIKYYAENNDSGFRSEAYEIAKDFDQIGDYQLAEYIMALMSNANTFVPQMNENESSMFEKVEKNGDPLWLPEDIMQDVLGIVHAVAHNAGINKMGQTQKNMSELFREINGFVHPEKLVILFDEIDAIALDRTNMNDLREMGRATSTLLKYLDRVDERIVLIATTNLFEHFDKALIRRFDSVIDFNRYSQEDLMDISEEYLNRFLVKFNLAKKDIRLFRKIMKLISPLPYPGDLKNLIKTAVAFSNPDDELDYFRRLYYTVTGEKPENIKKLQEQNFTIREIEILSKIPKSSVARELKEMN